MPLTDHGSVEIPKHDEAKLYKSHLDCPDCGGFRMHMIFGPAPKGVRFCHCPVKPYTISNSDADRC